MPFVCSFGKEGLKGLQRNGSVFRRGVHGGDSQHRRFEWKAMHKTYLQYFTFMVALNRYFLSEGNLKF
jgi:hypothetical protein